MLIILLVVLIVLALGGGLGYNGGAYRSGGFGIVGILVVVLIILFLTGALR